MDILLSLILTLAMVTLQTFYLGKNSGKVTQLISARKIFTPVEFFGATIQEGKMHRDLADQREVFFLLSRCYFLR